MCAHNQKQIRPVTNQGWTLEGEIFSRWVLHDYDSNITAKNNERCTIIWNWKFISRFLFDGSWCFLYSLEIQKYAVQHKMLEWNPFMCENEYTATTAPKSNRNTKNKNE